MVEEGLSEEAAKARLMVTDSKGLIFEGRSAPWTTARRRWRSPRRPSRVTASRARRSPRRVIAEVKPSVLIGVSGKPGTFNEPMIRAMAEAHAQPFVMPLSNPTSKSEAVPADILAWSDGRALIATGSPFPEVTYEGEVHRIGQANNVFIFPGMGLGCVVSQATKVTPGMFNAAARALARAVEDETLKTGSLYPPISRVREISHRVAHAVAEQAVAEGVAREIVDVEADIGQTMWRPVYLPYRPA